MVGKFSMATSESYKDKAGEWQENTEWHDVVVWRNLAERMKSKLNKGMLIYLEGKLTHRKWQDKEGNPRKTTEVVGSYIRLMPTGQRHDMPTDKDAPYVADDDYGIAGTNETKSPNTELEAAEPDGDLPF